MAAEFLCATVPAQHFFPSSVPYQPQFLPHFPFSGVFYLHIFAMSGVGGRRRCRGGVPLPSCRALHYLRPRAESFTLTPLPTTSPPLLVFDLHMHSCRSDWGPSLWRRRAATCRRAACNMPIKHQAVAERWTPTSVSMELAMCEIGLQLSNSPRFFCFLFFL